MLTVQEDGMEGRPDPEILARATELGRVLFTQDDDLLACGARRQRGNEPFTGVIYAHQEIAIGVCVADLMLMAWAAEPEEISGRVEFLPL